VSTAVHELWTILADTTTYPDIEEILPEDQPSPVISPQLARLLARLVVKQQARSILEFGAGTSSLIFAKALLRAGGGKLTSVEHQPQYSADSWQVVASTPTVDARLVVSPLRRRITLDGVYWWYAGAAEVLESRGPFDLVLIDAPPKSFGRDAPLFQALPYLSRNAVIVLDDARRRRESRIVQRWQRGIEGIELVAHEKTFGGRGVALLSFGDAPRAKPSLVNFVESVYEQWVRWRRGRNLPTDPEEMDTSPDFVPPRGDSTQRRNE
jgi:predicted O-methyltransferase YrrM